MKKSTLFQKAIIFCFAFFLSFTGFSQVTLTATSGTASGSFTTLKGAFDAINAGTHKGVIEIKINANTTEAASASLTASAALATSAPFYTRVTIYPTASGLSITGALAAPLINLNGADSVTIDGRVNATGSTQSLTITNTSAAATAGTSTIRFINDARANTVKYCTIKGSTTDAAAGIVFFSTAGTGTGNDNNTITNNDITCAADASRPLNVVYALGTSAKNNDNNTISNNNIYNFLSKATASQGINISSYNSGYTISNNSFYETASFTATAAVNYNVILISAATGTGNGFTISGNYIGGNTASCGGTAWTKTAQNNAFTAISVTTATGTANSIQENTIQNINWTNAGTSDFTGISIAGATVANIGTVTGNTIGAATGTGSITFTSNTTATDFYAINITSTDVVDCQNNIIGSITVANAATNASNFYGIVKSATAGTTTISNNTIGSTTTANSINASSASSTAANIQSVYGIQSAGTGTVTISENTIANIVNETSNTTVGSAGLISGIYVSAGTNTISNNTVRNLSIANANTNILSTPSVSGIVMASTTAAAQTVSGNTVHSLSNSFSTFAGGVIGIYYNGSTTASAVRGNFIHSLSVTGASSTTADIYGIKINAGTTTYSNNIINLGGNTTTDLFGIYQTGAASNNNSLFYNTINIAGSLVSGATNLSYALFSTATTNTRDFRNNILVNARSTVSGVSKHYALYIAASGGTITCNYNNYFVSGTGGVLGFFAADKTSLPIVTSNDANSIVTNPTFSNAGGTSATDFTPTVPGTAVTVTGITVDYTGTTRGTNVTMGAIELKQGANAPTNVVATALPSAASITFTTPSDIGAGAITNYQYSLDNGATWISTGASSSPVMIDSLSHCTAYQIKIRAVNVIGGGTASAAVTVTPQSGQSAVEWISRTPAANNNWSDVTYGNGLFVAVASTGTGNRVMTSPDGITWTSRISASDNNWQSVTYGNGLFVAVASSGTGNRVMTSPDGINWTSRTSATDNSWSDVTYGNNLFVAVSDNGSNFTMTSPNGITWTSSQVSPPLVPLRSVTYGNGLFVAMGGDFNGGRVWVSSDGINWTQGLTAFGNLWLDVTYGNGLFVAVNVIATGSSRVSTSTNGLDWSLTPTPVLLPLNNVTYGNGLFVAMDGGGTNKVITSYDGLNWTSGTTTPIAVAGLTYGNGQFVGVTSSAVMSSGISLAPDAPVITAITPRNNAAGVVFTQTLPVLAPTVSNYEYSTDNGSTWITRFPSSNVSPLIIAGLTNGTNYNIKIRAINIGGTSCISNTMTVTPALGTIPDAPTNLVITPFNNGGTIQFSAPANDGGHLITNYEYSTDGGTNWVTPSPEITTGELNVSGLTNCTPYTIKIRAVNARGRGAASVAAILTPTLSAQGINWTSRSSEGNTSIWNSVTNGNGLFVAVGSNLSSSNRLRGLMTSPDGITWTRRGPAQYEEYNYDLKGVTYGNGLFVAVPLGDSGLTSSDGINWTITPMPLKTWQSVTYGNGLFVAVANQNGSDTAGWANNPILKFQKVMTSPDGINWTIRTAPQDEVRSWQSVTYGNGLFVAVANTGTGNRVMTSPDGINWTSRTSAADNNWTSVTYGNGLFVAIGFNAVMTSPNGITWTSGTAPTGGWRGLTYGNGLFVAVANNAVMTSPDGITWTSRTSAENRTWNSVTCSNGQFVAVANNGSGTLVNRVMTSRLTIAADAPVISTATLGTTTTVNFTQSTSTFAPTITNYEYSTDNGINWVAVSPAATTSPLTITGLATAPNSIMIRAVNSVGNSCASNKNTGCTPTSSTETISACGSYVWHGTTYTTSGVKTWTGTNAAGCDSVVTLNLTINQATSSSSSASACGSYVWNGTTYTTSGVKTWTGTNAAGCDSVVTLNLTINQATSSSSSASACGSYVWNGTTYTTSGVKTWTGTNAAGCDSVVTLNLTINQATSSSSSASACGSYVWKGTTYTTSGVKTWTGTNAAGCDSVVTLNLTINQATSSSSSASACGSYVWNGTTYTTSGVKTWTGTNAAGCDSVVTLNLTINQATSSSSSASACGSYVWNGTTYTISGVKTWTGTNAAGCDSVVTLNLTINQATSSSSSESACGSYVWNGTTYTTSGVKTWTGTNAAGCDSVVTLNLTINQATSSSSSASACGSYVWNGTTYTTSGVKTWTGTNAAGCDSVVTLNLTIKQPTSSSSSESACVSYLWHGTTYNTSGAKTWTGTNAAGCDSVVTLNLTIKQPTSSSSSESACVSYLWHGTTYNTSGAKTWTGTNAAGCDSVVTLNLTIKQPTSSSSSESACVSYLWHGTTYTTSGAKTWTGTNAAGCDSVVTLNLTIKQPTISSTSQSASGSYSWNGNTYTSSGTYTWLGTNAAGCDSTATLNLTINSIVTSNITNVCTYVGTNQTLTYTASVAGASSYAWTLPANTQLVSGQGTRSIVIKLLNGFATQANKQIRVTPAGGSLQIIYTNAQAPVTPASIVASSTNICQSLGTNIPITFTIPRVYEQASNGRTATSYLWTAQNGTTTISHPNGIGENDTTVAVTFDANFTSSSITVQSVNACGVSAIRSYLINRNNPTVGVISGPNNSCEYIGSTGTVATYNAPAVTNINSYSWTLPIGAMDVSGQGTNTLSFKYPAGYTGGSISVTGTNGCGTSSARTLSICRLLPGTPGNIDVINTQLCPNREYSYSLASVPGNATSLIWTVPTGATIVNGQGTTSITVSYPNGVVVGNVTVKGLSNCGTSSTRTLIIKLAPCPTAPGTTYTKGVMSTMPTLMEVKVFPNPTTSSFNLQVTAGGSKSAIEARVLDLQGRLIKTMSIHPNENISLGAELKAGVYMLEVLQGEERKMVRVVKY